nr:CHC2 zinc finger domain-containing protein [uncultured Cohaesibacter sp.]
MSLTISRHDIDALKAKITLSDVIGKSVKLHRSGTWMVGLCPFHKEREPSFAVNDVRGTYRCFSSSCGEHGDIFDWIAYTDRLDVEQDFLAIFKRAQDIAGDHSVATSLPQYDPNERAQRQKEDSADRRLKALKLWRRGSAFAGSKAETYLRDCRGIRTVDFTGMPFRFIDNHERWIYCDELKKPVMVGRWPCLLTAIQEVQPNADGKHHFLALHRTWFELGNPKNPQGKVRIIYKAPSGKEREVKRKKIDGDYFGQGAIMLTPAGETLAQTEGIENGLTALELGPFKHVWVAVSMNALGSMPLLPITKRLAMIADSDSKSERTAKAHQNQLSKMMQSQAVRHGCQVDLMPAPPGDDLNGWHIKQLLRHALATNQ